MVILGIESSCDETAAALVTGERQVLASVISSQLHLHAPFGGVVPELASRQHLRDLPRVVAEAFRQSGLSWADVSGVAATFGPGLMGALLVGLTWSKAAAFARNLPFIGVNHLEGHLYAAELNQPELPYPFLGLVASGGHTSLYLVAESRLPKYRLLARTRDDAVGEAFDKVAKLLGLPYPGGPSIERTARDARTQELQFPLSRMKDGSLDFSYSGLKTAVRYWLDAQRKTGTAVDLAEVSAAFQRTVIQDLRQKTMEAVNHHPVKALVLSGGVAANRALREAFAQAAGERGLPFFTPPFEWCTDNAAMIAAVGIRYLLSGKTSPWDLPAIPNLEAMQDAGFAAGA